MTNRKTYHTETYVLHLNYYFIKGKLGFLRWLSNCVWYYT